MFKARDSLKSSQFMPFMRPREGCCFLDTLEGLASRFSGNYTRFKAISALSVSDLILCRPEEEFDESYSDPSISRGHGAIREGD